jgi:hypothetical protein
MLLTWGICDHQLHSLVRAPKSFASFMKVSFDLGLKKTPLEIELKQDVPDGLNAVIP